MNQDILALAFEGHPIRTTNEPPKRISVLDVLAAVGYAHPKKSWGDIQESYPELVTRLLPITFGGRGRPTPTLDKQGVLSLVMVLSGPKAAAFREWASSILVRYLEGDRTLAQEIHLRANDEEEDEVLSGTEPSEIFEEAAPAVMLALAEKAAKGSIQAARLLLQYHTSIKGPATTAERPSLPASSGSPLSQWWRECLATGQITPGYSVGGAVPVTATIRAYAAWTKTPVTRAMQTSFGMQFRQLVPALRRKASTQGGERRWYYNLPPLAECRRFFVSVTGLEVQS